MDDRAPLQRLEDIIVAAVLLVWLAVPLLTIAVAIRLTSKGPILVRERRSVSSPRTSDVLRFCTVGVESAQAGRDATKATVTRLGAFLRRTCLDELPQFLQLLNGETTMSALYAQTAPRRRSAERKLRLG